MVIERASRLTKVTERVAVCVWTLYIHNNSIVLDQAMLCVLTHRQSLNDARLFIKSKTEWKEHQRIQLLVLEQICTGSIRKGQYWNTAGNCHDN